MSREAILQKVRAALGRAPWQPVPAPPPCYLPVAAADVESRIAQFTAALEALGGRVLRASTPAAAGALAAKITAGARAIASDASFLRSCGVPALPGVRWEFGDAEEARRARAEAQFGITSADYALADTGSLVMLSGHEESRLVSLLPPSHIAVVPVTRLLTGLDELLRCVATQADLTSSMVIITGPSRTADIEQILVRGVHGPGEVTVILVSASR